MAAKQRYYKQLNADIAHLSGSAFSADPNLKII